MERATINTQTAILVWMTVIKTHDVTMWEIFSGERMIKKASTLQCRMQ